MCLVNAHKERQAALYASQVLQVIVAANKKQST